jgi:hypothetical protein
MEEPAKPRGPKDLHWLVALREKNGFVGVLFFAIGVALFGYLMFQALF